MRPTMYHPSTSAVRAEALFASVLQRSDRPSAGQVRKAVAAAVRAYGGRGCVELVAQEFGDHPEAGWSECAGRVPWPARCSPHRGPGLRAAVPEDGRGGPPAACADVGW